MCNEMVPIARGTLSFPVKSGGYRVNAWKEDERMLIQTRRDRVVWHAKHVPHMYSIALFKMS